MKVTGPKAVVDTIERAVVFVELEEGSVGIVDFKDCDIVFLAADSAVVEDASVTADVEKVTVSVPIIMRKTVPLKLEFVNAPEFTADFYRLTYTIGDESLNVPEDIEIAAVDDVFEEIESITIGKLDFEKIHSKSYTEEFTLEMPTGVTNISGITTVEVTITFNSMSTDSITFLPDSITIQGTPSGKTAEITSKSLRVTICGSSDSVKAAKNGGVSALVRLSTTSSGIRQYPVDISFGELNNVWVYVADGASAPAVNVEIK